MELYCCMDARLMLFNKTVAVLQTCINDTRMQFPEKGLIPINACGTQDISPQKNLITQQDQSIKENGMANQ